jgi:hypothetical protein
VAESSSVSRSRLSRSRWSGCSDSHSSACAVSAVVVSKPPPMISAITPSSSRSGGVLSLTTARASASIRPGLGFSLMVVSWVNMSWYISIWRSRTLAMSGESGRVYTAAWVGSQ